MKEMASFSTPGKASQTIEIRLRKYAVYGTNFSSFHDNESKLMALQKVINAPRAGRPNQ
jgi:hypothetical protein